MFSSFRKSSREWSQRDGGSLLNGNSFRLAEQGHNDSKRMKKYFASILVALMGCMCLTTFTACGDDEDDDNPGTETGYLTVGTHRIDADFEGNTSVWTVTVAFSAVKASASGMGARLYENGQELSIEGGTWMDDKFRSYSVSTDDNCQTLCCVIYCRRNAHATANPITIRLKGFVNGKQKKEQTYVADGSHPTKVITFYDEITGADTVQELDY